MARTPAWKRYNWRSIWLSMAYAVFLIGAVYGFKHRLIPNPLTYLVAILPALPIIGLFVAMGRYLAEEQDEYVRMLMVRQTLWASGFALSCATIWGFLENFDLVGHTEIPPRQSTLNFGSISAGATASVVLTGADTRDGTSPDGWRTIPGSPTRSSRSMGSPPSRARRSGPPAICACRSPPAESRSIKESINWRRSYGSRLRVLECRLRI